MELAKVLYTWSSGQEIRLFDLLLAIAIFFIGESIIFLINRKWAVMMFSGSSKKEEDRKKLKTYTRFFINLIIVILLIEILKVPTGFLTQSIGLSSEETGAITIGKVLNVLIIIYAAGGIAWLSKKFILIPFFTRKNLDQGRQFALTQFSMYIIYTLTAVFALSEVMHDVTILAGAFAGLAVGVGLGLQQTFNDLVSGVIMLVEGTVEVNDTVIIEGKQAKVKKIGLRTSTLETPDKMDWLVPNSKLVVDRLLNWSHDNKPSRFFIEIGVSYDADPEDMKTIWQNVCKHHKEVLSTPEPTVHLVAFADFSVNFKLFFYCGNFHGIEGVKSSLRFKLFKALKDAGIEIPYPQQVMITKT
jgi:small-conductance mechanosensitive channel